MPQMLAERLGIAAVGNSQDETDSRLRKICHELGRRHQPLLNTHAEGQVFHVISQSERGKQKRPQASLGFAVKLPLFRSQHTINSATHNS
jgi:hypothetical protein